MKLEARKSMRRRLREMSDDFRAEASLVICGFAAQLPSFRAGKTLALFSPLPTEPDIHPLIEEAWAQGKQVALPRLLTEETGTRLEWHAVTAWKDVIEPGPFGLREPDPVRCPLVKTESLSCVFVPGLAFDERGLRLGRGGGFYDRFLSAVPATLPRFGIMFTNQRVISLPREPHDQALPAIITEDGVVTFPAQSV